MCRGEDTRAERLVQAAPESAEHRDESDQHGTFLANALHPLDGKVQVAFVYGSMASGSEHSDSDIDLMLIGTLTPVELAVPLREAREVLGREINPTVYSPAEFREKREAGNPFLTRVLDRPRLFVVGNSHELDTIAD
jgi:predicted nucleotidyltransferase